MTGKTLIRCTRLAKMYNERLIFRDVAFTVRSGAVILLTGANGAGKSTLLKILSGLIRPSYGTVERDICDAETGYLGHGTFLYPRLTARENLFFWGRLYGLSEKHLNKRVPAMLERMALDAFCDEPAGDFSRGMSQRLNLARIFLGNPRLLLLDEPGAGLDVQSMRLLRREIAAAREAGAGIVWVSHNIEADAPLADQVLRLEDKTLKGAFDA